MDALKRENVEVSSTNEQLRLRNSKLEKNVKTLLQDSLVFKPQIANLNADLEDKKNEIEFLKNDLKRAGETLQEQEFHLKSLEREKKFLSESIAFKDSQLNAFKQGDQDLGEESVIAEVKFYEGETTKLNQQLLESMEELESYRQEVARLNATVVHKDHELSKCKDELLQLASQQIKDKLHLPKADSPSNKD